MVAKQKGDEFLENTIKHIPNQFVPIAGDQDEEEIREKVMAQTLQVHSDHTTEDEESEEEEQWDAESILTTLTNTDNHPNVIKFTPKVKTKNAVILHK